MGGRSTRVAWSLPGAALAAWFSWWWLPILGLIFVFTPLLFPTGRLPSSRWRPVAVTGGLAIAAVTVLGAVQPALKLQNEEVFLPNPVGLPRPRPGGRRPGAVCSVCWPAAWSPRSSRWCSASAAPLGWSASSSSGSPMPRR